MKPLVKNAGSEKQIKNAEMQAKIIRDQELNDLRSVLSTPQGRRVLWRFLEKCKVFHTIWRPSAEIHRLAGHQEIGHFILAEITNADEERLFEMMREQKKEKS